MIFKLAPLFGFVVLASAFAADPDCRPKTIQDGREVRTILGARASGEEAREEIRALRAGSERNGARISATVDLFGRELSTIVIAPIGETETTVENEDYSSARRERYCSQSAAKDAKCVDTCVRWTNFQDRRN